MTTIVGRMIGQGRPNDKRYKGYTLNRGYIVIGGFVGGRA